RLHDLRQRPLGELLQGPAGPLTVTALPEPLLDLHGDGPAASDGGGRLPAPLQRAGDDRIELKWREPLRHRPGLLTPSLVEMHLRGPPGEHGPGQLGETVPQQEEGRHDEITPRDSRVSRNAPAKTR